jgi:hypothetical protein
MNENVIDETVLGTPRHVVTVGVPLGSHGLALVHSAGTPSKRIWTSSKSGGCESVSQLAYTTSRSCLPPRVDHSWPTGKFRVSPVSTGPSAQAGGGERVDVAADRNSSVVAKALPALLAPTKDVERLPVGSRIARRVGARRRAVTRDRKQDASEHRRGTREASDECLPRRASQADPPLVGSSDLLHAAQKLRPGSVHFIRRRACVTALSAASAPSRTDESACPPRHSPRCVGAFG